MSKPTNLAVWATGGGAQIDEPTLLEKQTGWIPAGQPPAEWFNWWMNAVYLWVVWLDAFESTIHTWSAVQTFSSAPVFSNGFSVNGNVSFNASVGLPTFHAGASFTDKLDFTAFGGVKIEDLGSLWLRSIAGTGGAGFSADGEIILDAGVAAAGAIALRAKTTYFGGVAEEDNASQFYFGDPAGPDRVLGFIINGTLWFAWNASYSSADTKWRRHGAGDSYAFAIGIDAGAGLPEAIKILRHGADEADAWDSYGGANGWQPMGLGTGSAAGALGAPLARMIPVAPTLGNNFVNSALTGVEVAGYWKDHFGTVHLQGVLKLGSGSSGNPAFTLPAPFRPAYHRYFVNRGVTATGNTVLVKPDGTVNVYGVSGDEVTLEGLQFN